MENIHHDSAVFTLNECLESMKQFITDDRFEEAEEIPFIDRDAYFLGYLDASSKAGVITEEERKKFLDAEQEIFLKVQVR